MEKGKLIYDQDRTESENSEEIIPDDNYDEFDANQQIMVCTTENELRYALTCEYNIAIELANDIVVTGAPLYSRETLGKTIYGHGHSIIFQNIVSRTSILIEARGSLRITDTTINAGAYSNSDGYAIIATFKQDSVVYLENCIIIGGAGPRNYVQCTGAGKAYCTNVYAQGDFVFGSGTMICKGCHSTCGAFIAGHWNEQGVLTLEDCFAYNDDNSSWSNRKDCGIVCKNTKSTINATRCYVYGKINGVANDGGTINLNDCNIYSNIYMLVLG